MRRLTVFPVTLFASLIWIGATTAGEISWLNSIDQARQIAAQNRKMVLVHFWSTSCAPCAQLERQVYNQAGIGQEISTAFVPVKINAEQYPAVAQQYQVQFVPTDVIIAADGRVLSRQSCPLNRSEYVAGLTRVAATQAAPQLGPYVNVAAAGAHGLAASTSQLPGGPVAGQPAPTYPPIEQQSAAAAQLGDRYGNYAAQQSGNAISGVAERAQAATGNAQDALGRARATILHPPVGGANPSAGYAPYVPQAAPPATAGPSMPATPAGTPTANPYAGVPVAAGIGQPPAGLPAPGSQPGTTIPILGQPSIAPPPTAQPPAAQPPAGRPPMALDGSCPVELIENERWVRGDPRWGAIHRGRLYLFGGEAQKQRFMGNPDYYSPVLSGNDPVLALDRQQMIPGRRQHGVFYNRRVYLFAGEQSLAQFYSNARRYADGARQAEAAGQSTIR